MKINSASSLLLLSVVIGASAFSLSQKVTTGRTASTKLFHRKGQDNDNSNLSIHHQLQKTGTSFVAAAAIFTGAVFADLSVAAPPAYANVELSRGAFVIRTSAEQGALMKTQIDSKSLIKTFFSNRKAVSESLGRIQKSVQQELKEPVWLELQKEIMDIEGDVAPTIQFTPPVDIQQAVKDFSQGKINFLLNGEIFNIAVEPTFSEKEDDLVIKVKGFKGELLPYQIAAREAQAEARKGPIETQLAKYEAFWEFWNQPYPSQVSDEPSNESVMMKKVW
jgi:hypothetical protein